MSKLSVPILLYCLLTLSFCAGRKHASTMGSYTVTGTVKGIADGTWIYLESMNSSNRKSLLDSALVKEERFEFRGQLNDKVLQTMVGLKELFYAADGTFKGYWLTDAAMLWLENSNIIIEGEKGKLFQARITGSGSQQDFERMMSPAGQGEDDTHLSFIRQSPNSSYLSIYLLNLNKDRFGKEVTAELFNLMAEDKRESHYGREVSAYLRDSNNKGIN